MAPSRHRAGRCGDRLLASVAGRLRIDLSSLSLAGGRVVAAGTGLDLDLAEAAAGEIFEETVTFRHEPTEKLDDNGQGNAHVSFAFAAHRAVVEVDLDLGLVKVVEVATSQDVGRVLNPLQVVGQLEGGISQGVGLAVMEEIVLDNGHVRNAVLHRLHHPDCPRHAGGRHRGAHRGARAGGALWRKGRRRATVDLVDRRRRGGDTGCHRPRAVPGSGPPTGHRSGARRPSAAR